MDMQFVQPSAEIMDVAVAGLRHMAEHSSSRELRRHPVDQLRLTYPQQVYLWALMTFAPDAILNPQGPVAGDTSSSRRMAAQSPSQKASLTREVDRYSHTSIMDPSSPARRKPCA